MTAYSIILAYRHKATFLLVGLAKLTEPFQWLYFLYFWRIDGQ
jgi:hypothetical protein